MNEVALELARASGALGKDEPEGYESATVRVKDVVAMTDVRKRLDELGFGSFSIVDQLEQLRTVFLIINSALGLLGGISLLVASFLLEFLDVHGYAGSVKQRVPRWARTLRVPRGRRDPSDGKDKRSKQRDLSHGASLSRIVPR